MARTKKMTATKMIMSAKRTENGDFDVRQSRIDLFESVCLNIQTIGNKMFAFIPVSLIEIDERFQRVSSSSKSKIQKLAERWDSDKMDPIRVTIHEKEKSFSVIDGFHRVTAAKQLGQSHLACEVIDVPQEEMARLKREAELFATQMDEVEVLTPLQKHPANLVRGMKANVALENICKKYSVPIRADLKRGGGRGTGYLTGFSIALRLAESDPSLLDKIFDLICYIGWKNDRGAFSGDTLRMFWNVLVSHPEDQDVIITTLKEWLRKKDPDFVQSSASAKYPERSSKIRSTLIIEDYLNNKINLPYVYKKKTEKKGKVVA